MHRQSKLLNFLKSRIQPDVFVVSPLLRAQETLAHIKEHFVDVPVVICNTIKPDDDAKVAVEWLSHLPYESIVVVCHMNVGGTYRLDFGDRIFQSLCFG